MMTTYLEIHALQTVPPSNMNRDDAGTPKTALYGGVTRARVSSQSWKRAIRSDFNEQLDPTDVGTRSRTIVAEIANVITDRRRDLADQATPLAVAAMEAAGFKKPVPPKRKNSEEGSPETGYLVFLSQRQIESLADAAIGVADEADPLKAMRAAKVKDLVDADHSVDIALFGRMVADSADLNVDAACQVAHAISVHEANPEYDFYTAVDDAKSRNEDEVDAGAGMMGTVGFLSSTFYRYAVINVDQLLANLGSAEAASRAITAFMQSFINAMPSGKQNTFANGTRPAAVLVTLAEGQPTSLVGAFEQPTAAKDGYLRPAIEALAAHGAEVFSTWRQPSEVWVTGLPSTLGSLANLGAVVSLDELTSTASAKALEAL
jgi:CRISPR system Cascade subunit CasC